MRFLKTAARTVVFSLLFASSLPLFSETARAQPQVSDADRKAARDLYFAGIDAQNKGQFAEALDKFQRANQVFPAPTNLLHIAECQAAVGKLVEATETYRSVTRTQLQPGAPQAFVAAKDQAAAELSQVEPRVPELRIDVSPPNVPTLSVTVDEQPLNTALVGVARPINPGTHRIAASAPGYSRAEQQIDVKEKAKQAITLTLTSNGGVVYGPPGGGAVQPVVPPPTGSGQTNPPPPVTTEPEKVTPTKPLRDPRSQMSVLIGLRLGAYVPGGEVPDGNATVKENVKIGDISGVGGGGGIEGHLRFVRTFTFGLLLEGASFGGKDVAGTAGVGKTTSSTGLLMGTFGWLSNPEGLAFWPEIGVGYRAYSAGLSGNSTSTTQQGLEFMIGAGVHFKAGPIRLVPKAELDFGGFSKDVTLGTSATTTQVLATHFFAFFGLTGYFDVDLDKPPPTPVKKP